MGVYRFQQCVVQAVVPLWPSLPPPHQGHPTETPTGNAEGEQVLSLPVSECDSVVQIYYPMQGYWVPSLSLSPSCFSFSLPLSLPPSVRV